jgi:hypothetical protein
MAYLRRRKAVRAVKDAVGRAMTLTRTTGVCDVAQETYKTPEVQWWGLPVGLTFIVSSIAATFYVNLGQESFVNGLIGAIALLVLAAGIVSLGAFIYSVIGRSIAETEAKNYIPGPTGPTH